MEEACYLKPTTGGLCHMEPRGLLCPDIDRWAHFLPEPGGQQRSEFKVVVTTPLQRTLTSPVTE